MKIYLASAILLLLTFKSFSQDIKVKKGDVFLEGTLVGKLEKTGNVFKGRTYTLKSLDNSIVAIGSAKFSTSILDKMDLRYISIQLPAKEKTVGLEEKEFPAFGLENTFVKFFLENKIFENGKFNGIAADEFIKTHPDTIPTRITSFLNKEQEFMADMATIAERDRTKEIQIFTIKPDTKEIYLSQFSAQNFQILQDNVKIGFASILSNSFQTEVKLIFYNINQTPIGSLDLSKLGSLKIYSTNTELSFTQHEYNTRIYTSPKEKIKVISKFLISKDVL
ncbi:MAG: hypothetical protein JWQ25_2430 [Daejeonella sp.]|nr:hypothetical protein [Daejeonella sp.]